ncbi:hypothetical protein DFH11DRAFT_1515098 [Phellopilus nigrolimitatus]|nr:hypothetical protein DFH11DRAFT_1515098 [Phellopilus nigrolimitatus]
MANARVMCTDKTGTLNQNMMTVVVGCVSIRVKFVLRLAKNQVHTNMNNVLSPALQRLFNEALVANPMVF